MRSSGTTAPQPETRLRVAFAGAGRMAENHLAALRRVAVPHVVGAVFDGLEARAQEFADSAGARAYRSMDEMLNGFEPQVVHVCTPRGRHFDLARKALDSGAHVYVEKPFVETAVEARTLLDIARRNNVLVCAGHQLVADPAFVATIARVHQLRPVLLVDSHFAFRPGLRLADAGRDIVIHQLADILPHPLYTLIAALERLGADPRAIELETVRATLTDLHAMLRWGEVCARLTVTLRSRPIASWLTISGEGGSLTADFARSAVLGSANPGTEALEKVLNPLVEAWRLAARSVGSLAKRLATGVDYPGLAELIGSFYSAVVRGGHSPVSPPHLLRTTEIYEELLANVRAAPWPRVASGSETAPAAPIGTVVVTGARGFLGTRIARSLTQSGYRVRGISRTPDPDHPYVHEWVQADLSTVARADAFAGASAVVHAAAETAGGFDEHRRNTIDATRNVLRAMEDAGVTRLVHVSSLSVLQPRLFRRLDEGSPLIYDPRSMGPYAWGKCLSEFIARFEAQARGITVRVVRPAALVDVHQPDVPGLLGRRLFGRWHLGLGSPWLRIAVCPVDRCAAAIAWCVARFDDAPPVVNLMDPTIRTRGELLDQFRAEGWHGLTLWVPISAVSAAFQLIRTAMALARGTLPERRAVWSVLRPQRFDTTAARALLAATVAGGTGAPTGDIALGTKSTELAAS